MYIRNKSGLVQECHNVDVIRACQKDTKHFAVMEDKAGVVEDTHFPKAKPLDEMTVPELKTLAKEKGISGASSLTKDELLEVLKGVM